MKDDDLQKVKRSITICMDSCANSSRLGFLPLLHLTEDVHSFTRIFCDSNKYFYEEKNNFLPIPLKNDD